MAVLPGYEWIDNPRSGGGTYATDGPSSILLHMTVSMGLSASYVSQHPYPPHFWANPYTGDKWQTISPDRSAFALYQPGWSNSWTNKKGYTLQTELVGVPVVNQETYSHEQCMWIAQNVVVPQAEWLASVGHPVDLNQVCYHTDSSSSASENWPGRMSEAAWDSFNGLCAHIDAPYQDHWDCSVERTDLIAAYARDLMGGSSQPSQEMFPVGQYEDIMTHLYLIEARVKKVRMIECKGAYWLTDFINVTYIGHPNTVIELARLGWLDNDLDAAGNPIPQGCSTSLFDTLHRLDTTGPGIAVGPAGALREATTAQLIAELNAKLGK